MAKKLKNPTKVITGPETRWSYVNVWEPKSMNDGTPKYTASSSLFPRRYSRLKKSMMQSLAAAYNEGQSKLRGNGRSVPPLSAIKTPLRDGD